MVKAAKCQSQHADRKYTRVPFGFFNSVCLQLFKIEGHRETFPHSEKELPAGMVSSVNFAKHFRKK